jgi:hypothetical protein
LGDFEEYVWRKHVFLIIKLFFHECRIKDTPRMRYEFTTLSVVFLISYYGKIWASRRNIWDASPKPRVMYVCIQDYKLTHIFTLYHRRGSRDVSRTRDAHHHQTMMSPLLGHRLSLWITNKAITITRAQCGLVGANYCKYSRDQRHNVPSAGCMETHVGIFSWNQTSISYVNSSIKLNFSQSADVNLKPRKRCVFRMYFVISK